MQQSLGFNNLNQTLDEKATDSQIFLSHCKQNSGRNFPIIVSQVICDNYLPHWWVEFDDELSWSFTNRFKATR